MKKILLWLWQLPQHLLALIIWGILRLMNKILIFNHIDGKWLITVDVPGWGISLGIYIFMDQHYPKKEWVHEFGHSIQSEYTGPVYLPLVGIPSAVFNNLWDRLFHKNWTWEKRHTWYYNRYPEKWADRLGGVKR